MIALVVLLLILALVGHWSLCVGFFNRVAASRMPCAIVGPLEKLGMLMSVAVPIGFVAWFRVANITSLDDMLARPDGKAWLFYQTFCLIAAGRLLIGWWSSRREPVPQLVTNDTEHYNIAAELGHWPVGSLSGRLGSWIPANEICRLAVPVKTLRMSTLPQELDGLSIVHLSDLHFTGQLTLDYYRYVIDRANEQHGDIVVITGDIIDKEACLDWLPETFGRLKAKHGVYFILGNHDKRLPVVADLRKRLTQCGMIDVGGRVVMPDINGVEVHIAGNELPWFPLRAAKELFDPEARASNVFRILLSHTPDQYVWAREHHYDLMLAGHCHGGQIRVPGIGAIVSPSRYGAKYASGLFYETPTLLHVSRGLGGTHPLRWNCPPELATLVLHRAEE
jgi:predicted MPP superfamily phosphohydrolase